MKTLLTIALALGGCQATGPAPQPPTTGCVRMAEPDEADLDAGMDFSRSRTGLGRWHIGTWNYGWSSQEDSLIYNEWWCVARNAEY